MGRNYTVACDAAPTLEAICANLDEHGVAKVRWPERLEVVETIPLTTTGKSIKGRLIEPCAAPSAAGGGDRPCPSFRESRMRANVAAAPNRDSLIA